IRRIRELLYEQGFTISGARNKLESRNGHDAQVSASDALALPPLDIDTIAIRNELEDILDLLRR
ncbi:MAG: MerR family transcriptional regulator, partial [Lacisediminimonas sp.]|nr:MerR family transcriptional regulator [Lacisediminimonas sp.]